MGKVPAIRGPHPGPWLQAPVASSSPGTSEVPSSGYMLHGDWSQEEMPLQTADSRALGPESTGPGLE